MAESALSATGPGQDGTSEEVLLRDYLHRVGDNRAGLYAVHVHLSDLRPGNRQPNFIRIAARSFEYLVNNFEATLYPMSNADLILVCRDVPVDEVDSVILKARALFHEDPLTAGEDGAFGDRFTTWYDLSQPDDYVALIGIADQLLAETLQRQRREAEAVAAAGARAMTGRPLDPPTLAAIRQQLQGARLFDLIHQQTAVQVRHGGKGRVLFREHFVSMFELQKRVAPGVNLFGNMWLFQYMTEFLDRRLLAILSRRGLDEGKDSISLNLNVPTVLSRDFQEFHQGLGTLANRVIIEVQLIDALADMGAFAYARDSLRERGYRVLIDGLNPFALQFFDAQPLEADFIKINWSREFLGDDANRRPAALSESVARAGPERIVLARVETEEAVKWGTGLGITGFQGQLVDEIVETMSDRGMI